MKKLNLILLFGILSVAESDFARADAIPIWEARRICENTGLFHDAKRIAKCMKAAQHPLIANQKNTKDIKSEKCKYVRSVDNTKLYTCD